MSIRDDQFFSLIQDYVREERWEDILNNLLAVLNGDGGHYQARHGTAEAVANGIDRFYDRLCEIGALKAQIASLTAEAVPVDPHLEPGLSALMSWMRHFALLRVEPAPLSTAQLKSIIRALQASEDFPAASEFPAGAIFERPERPDPRFEKWLADRRASGLGHVLRGAE